MDLYIRNYTETLVSLSIAHPFQMSLRAGKICVSRSTTINLLSLNSYTISALKQDQKQYVK